MKFIAILAVSLAAFWGQPTWLTDFETAKNQAAARNVPILVNFSGSDWCAPCIKMKKEIFEQTDFTDYAESNLVLLRADFPRKKKNMLSEAQTIHNDKLAELYNPTGKFPLTILLDSKGKVIKKWEGLPKMTAKEFTAAVKKAANPSK